MAGLRTWRDVRAIDLGKIQMVDGLDDFGAAKAAWSKDSEGNTCELTDLR